MGNLIRKVELSSLDEDGNAGRPHQFKALIDTGATITVISKRILHALRANSFDKYPATIGGRSYPTALIAVKLDGEDCTETPLVVVVADAYARKAGPGAQMILGHDYLQREQSVLAYSDEPSVSCGRKKRAAKKR